MTMTNETPEPKNVYEAINQVMGRVGYVQKESAKKLDYKVLGEQAFIQAVRPHLVDLGLTIHQTDVELLGRTEFTAKSGAQGVNILAKYHWRWTHAPTETFIEVTSLGEASDYGDKAANKTMTVALKYALRQTLVIETGDDPDATPSEEYEQSAKKTKKEKPAERQPFSSPVGEKKFPPEKAEILRTALVDAKVLPDDTHDKHFEMFLDLIPFGIEVPTKELVGWGKLYRDYKKETGSTEDAVRMAGEAWFSGETSD